MKKPKKGKQTLGQAFDGFIEHRIDQMRPHLLKPPGKSWIKWGASQTSYASIKGTGRLIGGAIRATYHALTPEEMPDKRPEVTEALWDELAGLGEIDVDAVTERIYEQIQQPLSIYKEIVRKLIGPVLSPPEFPEHGDAIAHAQWRDEARSYLAMYHATTGLSVAATPILAAIKRIERHLPAPSQSATHVPILDLIPNVPATLEAVIGGFYAPRVIELGLFKQLRERLDGNALDDKGNIVLPTASKLAPRKMIERYLDGTPLLQLFNQGIPFSIPDETRFSHTWIVSTTGHGKTTFLAGLLKDDIERIKRGEISAVVIDSQNQLIPQLKQLDVPKILIDPYDIEHPIALSLFNIGYQQLRSEEDQYACLQGALLTINFIVGGLFDQEMTPRQTALFDHIAELLITQKPDATMHDFRNLLDPVARKDYASLWKKASPEVANFFETEFEKNRLAADTAQQVLTRLRPLLRNRVFLNAFSSTTTKLDLGEELNKGRLVLVDTFKQRLTPPVTKMIGRFWLGQIAGIANRRQDMAKKLPTFVYVDEAQDYLRGGDPNIVEILDQARKQRIGLSIIHHRVDQLESKPLEGALEGNTWTQIVGSLTPSDMLRFGRIMNGSAEFFRSLKPRETFGCYIKGNDAPFPITFQNTKLSPELTPAQVQAERQANRERYCYVPPRRTEPQSPPPLGGDPDEDVVWE